MRLIAIADLFIPREFLLKGLEPLQEKGVEIGVVDWGIDSFEDLQNLNLLIEQNGCEAVQLTESLSNQLASADIIITHFCPITKAVIDGCSRLQAIGVLRGGIENVNFTEARAKGIMVFNTPGRNADAVSDFTIGMIISECRNIARGHMALKKGLWKREFSNHEYIPDLKNKSVGIIGLGEIGLKVAQKISGFNVKLLGYDPYVSPQTASEYNVQTGSLEWVLKESDFITLHARLTPETEKLIGAKELSLMKPTAYIINTSRSGLIDEKALYNVLKQRKIYGAAIDVFDKEPPGKNYPLVSLDNVTITPHIAGGTTDAFYNSPVKLCGDLRKMWEGEEPSFLINKESLHYFTPRESSLKAIGG